MKNAGTTPEPRRNHAGITPESRVINVWNNAGKRRIIVVSHFTGKILKKYFQKLENLF
jgi:hypothetical protein